MIFDYDPNKEAENIEKHGMSFENVQYVEWETAITKKDNRWDYGEDRYISYAYLGRRLHTIVWTCRDDLIRIISFRKSNKRERSAYDKEN